MLIAVLVILLNFYSTKVDANSYEANLSSLELNPKQTASIIDAVSGYTPVISEDADVLFTDVALNASNGFMNKDALISTEASKLETEYIVQRGDTISGIANKFSLHVATIADRNSINIDNIENLQPGQKLIIPSNDTSNSQDWLVQLNQKKEKDRQLAAQKAAQQKAKLAKANRSTVARESSSSDYSGEDTGSWSVPVNYEYVSRRIQRGHYGVDMVCDTGTSVRAAKSGKVVEITRNWGSGFGNSILVDHGGGLTSRYAHLSGFEVGIGDYVSQGQLIGESGNTGWSTGPHLHFEVRQYGTAIDPLR